MFFNTIPTITQVRPKKKNKVVSRLLISHFVSNDPRSLNLRCSLYIVVCYFVFIYFFSNFQFYKNSYPTSLPRLFCIIYFICSSVCSSWLNEVEWMKVDPVRLNSQIRVSILLIFLFYFLYSDFDNSAVSQWGL